MSLEKNAVLVRNACFSFGKGKDASIILDHLNMNVTKGSIYGLLGASGCGKTTLLSCIVGLLAVDRGEVRVLGGVPGTEGSGVPGPRVGYMPQELALVNEMDVGNVIYYFGWLFGMTSSQIAKRYVFLSKLLDLPDRKMLVENLSGGQQRRVSLAASLVQTPELLILDEPTVGLDPILRQNTWDYLVQLSRDLNMTTIITTHYIEEATQAHKVGLMRGGTLLADMAPQVLIANHSCTTLEEVFLKLSQIQGESFATNPRRKRDAIANTPITEDEDIDSSERGNVLRRRSVKYYRQENDIGSMDMGEKTALVRSHKTTTSFANRMKALMYKDSLALSRNKLGLIVSFIQPLVLFTMFFMAVGNGIQNIPIGIVNDEITNCHDIIGDIRKHSGVLVERDNYGKELCHFHGLSCLFIDKFEEPMVKKMYFSDTRSALVAAKKGVTAATIYFPSNFSKLLEARVTDALGASNETIDNCRIRVWLDMSSYVIAMQLQPLIYNSYTLLLKDLAVGCNLDKRTSRMPVQFMKPVYGDYNQMDNYRQIVVSGSLIGMSFFNAAMGTATLFTTERNNGVWSRNFVGGVSIAESILSHLLCQVSVIIVQTSEMIILMFYVYDIDCKGSIMDVTVIVFLQYLAGTTHGLLITTFSKDSKESTVFTFGSYTCLYFIMGAVWPLEGAPKILQYASYYSPGTLASNSMRNIITRGWGIMHPQVLPGYVMSICWIIGQFGISVWTLGKKMSTTT